MTKATPCFSNRPSTQASSQLFTLPKEILLQILRLILRHGHLLSVKRTNDLLLTRKQHPMTTRSFLQQSSAVFRTCQQLYFEGTRILYQENILEVTCHEPHASRIPLLCDFLQTRFKVPHDFSTALESIQNRRSLGLEEILRNNETQDLNVKHNVMQDYEFASNFSRVQVRHVGRFQPQAIYNVCYVLAHFLRDKHIGLEFRSQRFYDFYDRRYANAESAEFGKWDLMQLLACQNLRCKSLTVQHDWSVNIDPIVQTITGSSPVCDLLRLWYQFHSMVIANVPEVLRSKFLEDNVELWDEADEVQLRRGAITELHEDIITNNEPAFHQKLLFLETQARGRTKELLKSAMNGLELIDFENGRVTARLQGSMNVSAVSMQMNSLCTEKA